MHPEDAEFFAPDGQLKGSDTDITPQRLKTLNMHVNHQGNLLKCRFSFTKSGVEPGILHF